jgi:hypothetical protein
VEQVEVVGPGRAAGLEQGVEVAGKGLTLGAGQVDVVQGQAGGAEAEGGLMGQGGLAGPLRAGDGDQRRSVLRSVGDGPTDEIEEGRVDRQC